MIDLKLTPAMERHAQRGMEIVMRESYAKAKATGTLQITVEGHEIFELVLPADAPVMAPLVGCRMTDGSYRLGLESLHAALGGDEAVGPWEHFEHNAIEMAKMLHSRQQETQP